MNGRIFLPPKRFAIGVNAAKNKEYKRHLDLLEGVVFGW